MAINMEIREGKLVITTDLNLAAPATGRGGHRMVVTTRGNYTTNFLVEGRPIVVNLNAWISDEVVSSQQQPIEMVGTKAGRGSRAKETANQV